VRAGRDDRDDPDVVVFRQGRERPLVAAAIMGPLAVLFGLIAAASQPTVPIFNIGGGVGALDGGTAAGACALVLGGLAATFLFTAIRGGHEIRVGRDGFEVTGLINRRSFRYADIEEFSVARWTASAGGRAPPVSMVLVHFVGGYAGERGGAPPFGTLEGYTGQEACVPPYGDVAPSHLVSLLEERKAAAKSRAG
jgi:hypothetical protein